MPSRGRPNQPSDILGFAITERPIWGRWFAQFCNRSKREISKISVINFDASHLAVDSAKRDHGVVLTSSPLLKQDLESGELIEPFKAQLAIDEGYFVVIPKGAFTHGGIASSLPRWLRQECHLDS